ncbi:MAG: hemagluttinin repeat-containing protein, partial [Bacteroidetes bacterium]|nr:hemagluttinin repeat-containing protein [Bacteroidota bacterium]
MHKVSISFLVGVFLLSFSQGDVLAQSPQYYNYNTTIGSNSFPLNQALGKMVQWLVAPGELNQPTPAPSGNITSLSVMISATGARSYTNLFILLGQTSATTLPTGGFYTGQLDTVYKRASVDLTGTLGVWLTFVLDTPFLYDPAQSLVIQIEQCGATGTGMSIGHTNISNFRRSYSLTNAPCPWGYQAQGLNVLHCGVDVGPAAPLGWSAQTSGVTTGLNSVKAVSQSVVWAAGNGGVVLRTTNGGTGWTSVGGGAIGTQDLYAIDAISATTAFVTGTPSTTTYMFRTTNGGTTWDTVFTQAGGFLDAIKMYDATNGVALGDPVTAKWVIIRTTNGGTTWARIATEPNQVATEAGSNNGMATLGTTHIWFCSNSSPPKVYRSTDAGATWASTNLPGTATFTAGISFINTQYGVSGGNNGNAARSTDGGVTWTAV